jgi:hypothetical protein
LKVALGLGLAAVMSFVMGSAFLTSQPAPQSTPAVEASAVIGEPPAVPNEEEDDADVDVQGNPVSDAVAKYKFDPTGSLYELHSPQTELPRLAPPKT